MAKNSLPITFEEFKQSCSEHGYNTRVKEEANWYVMYTKNSIKTEIKHSYYTVGYGRKKDELDILEEELKSNGFSIMKRNVSCINVHFDGQDVLKRFWDIVEMEENIDSIVGKSRGVARRVFSNEVAESNLFEKIAKRYRNAIENEDQDMLDVARDLLSADKRDDLITIGRSVNHTEENSYREHAVPCIMIHNKAIEMTLNERSITEIAQMIKTNLAIVLISNEEQKLLDEALGWKTTMPEGWDFGQDPLARLNRANIKLR